MPKSIESLWRTVEDTDEKVCSHERKFGEIEEKQAYLEKGHDTLFDWKKEIDKWKQQTDANYMDLKMTILQENKETRTFFQTIMQNQWDLIKSRDDKKHDLAKSKLEKYSEIILKVVGAGGVLILLIQLLLGK